MLEGDWLLVLSDLNHNESGTRDVIIHVTQVHHFVGKLAMKRQLAILSITLAVTLTGCREDPVQLKAPGLPAAMLVVSGDDQVAEQGTQLPNAIAALVTDSSGTPVPDFLVNFVVLHGGGSVFAPAVLTDATGVARQFWTVGPAAADSQVVEARAVHPATGAPLVFARFRATSIPPDTLKLAIVTAPSATATNRALFAAQPVIRLTHRDGSGLAQAGVVVTAALSGGSGSLDGTATATTDASGTATFTNLSLRGTVGAKTISFSATGYLGISAPVALGAGAPATMTLSAGDNQSALSGEAVRVNPAVLLSDLDGNVVPGATVNFAVTSAGGTVTATGVTSVAGLASTTWTLHTTIGANTMTASLAGTPSISTSFSATGFRFQQVSAAGDHTCALTTAGAVYCWGSKGINTSTGNEIPRPIPELVPHTEAVVRLFSAPGRHTCGLTATNQAVCWGFNSSGQLGNGSTGSYVLTPQAVVGGLTFSTLTAGGSHSCGIAASNGGIYCWGRFTSGGATNLTPTLVTNGPNGAERIAVGLASATFGFCDVEADGAVYCWGSSGNWMGTSGASVLVNASQLPGGIAFQNISVGSSTGCGVTSSGAGYCWGRNTNGMLGNGGATTTTELNPVPVSGGQTWSTIGVGGTHVCGLTTSGAAYCWGSNGNGATGLGAFPGTQMTPAAVVGGLSFISLAVGDEHTCAVATTGAAYCWGRSNIAAKLGNGTSSAKMEPTRVVNP